MSPIRTLRTGNIGLAAGLMAIGGVLLAANFGRPVGQALMWWPLVPLLVGLEMLAKYAYARRRGGVQLTIDRWAITLSILVIVFGLVLTPIRLFTADGSLPFINFSNNVGQVFGIKLGSNVFRAERSGIVASTDSLSAGDKLVFHAIAGSIRVTGKAGASQVTVDYKVTTRDRSEEAARALADGVSLVPSKTGNTLEIQTRGVPSQLGSGPDFPSVALDVEVTVPPEVEVIVDSKFGSVTVEGIHANVRAETKFGEVRVNKAQGSIYAWTDYGQVQLRDVSGTVDAGSQFGKVSCFLADVTGPCRLSTKFGGVECGVPKATGLNYSINAQANRGRVTSTLPMSITTDGMRSTGTYKIGNGQHLIDLRADFGEISILAK